MDDQNRKSIAQADRAYGRRWWLARCSACSAIISRYDFTADEAQHNGETAIREDQHSCLT